MKTCIFSRRIPKSSMGDTARIIESDIRLVNRATHKALKLHQPDADFGVNKKRAGLPDLRLKENAALKNDAAASVFIRIKDEFGVDAYRANAAVQAANGVLRGVLELRAHEIAEKKDGLKDVTAKCRKAEKRLAQLKGVLPICMFMRSNISFLKYRALKTLFEASV